MRTPLTPASIRAQPERMLTRPVFVDAERARSFLPFIIDQSLESRGGDTTESVIA